VDLNLNEKGEVCKEGEKCGVSVCRKRKQSEKNSLILLKSAYTKSCSTSLQKLDFYEFFIILFQPA
jgi:hypothetical protein